jgi:hypothetical protein
MSQKFFMVAGIFFQIASGAVQAQVQDVGQTLDVINNTADRICGVVRDSGSASSSAVQGAVNAELSGLASRLAGAGLQGTVSITNEDYQGVLRNELGSTLSNVAACKLKVFESLQNKLILAGARQPADTCNFQRLHGGVDSNPTADGMWWLDFFLPTRALSGTFRLGKSELNPPRGHPEDYRTAAIMSIECKGDNFSLQEMNSSNGNNCYYLGKISGLSISGTYMCTQVPGARGFLFTATRQ